MQVKLCDKNLNSQALLTSLFPAALLVLIYFWYIHELSMLMVK